MSQADRNRRRGPPGCGQPPARARSGAAWRRRLTILALLSPWLAGFTVFFAYPLVWSGYLSLTKYDLLSSPRWVGLDNYRFLLQDDPQIWPAVWNTLWFIAVSVPLTVPSASASPCS